MDNLKTSFFTPVKFTNQEILTILLTSFVTGLVLFLNDWSIESYGVQDGVLKTIVYVIIAFLIIYTTVNVQKRAGNKLGYTLNYECSRTQSMSSVFFGLVSAGWLMMTTQGMSVMSSNAKARAGQLQPGVNNFDRAKIILSGAAYLIFLVVLLLIFFNDSNGFVKDVSKVIVFIGLFMLVPIPGNQGLYLLIWNKIISFIIFIVWLLLGVLVLARPELLVNMVVGGVVLGLVSVLELLPRITVFK